MLIFQLTDFGITASLQDNGEVAKYNKEILDKIGNATLHPAQFQEVCARFIYTNYIMRNFPDFTLTYEENSILFRLPEDSQKKLSRFSFWMDETFAQVLANFWKPWGLTIEQIYNAPNSPISFLIDEATHEFIKLEEISLPY